MTKEREAVERVLGIMRKANAGSIGAGMSAAQENQCLAILQGALCDNDMKDIKRKRAQDVHSAILDLNVAIELAMLEGLRVDIDCHDINRLGIMGGVPFYSVKTYEKISPLG
jgi:hypothetical protein